jgi:predicted metal-dependent peptidase
MHCAAGHPWRRDARDPQQWNEAADYAINGILKAANFALPEGGLIDPQYDGRSSEWIYSRLPPKPKNDKNGGKNGNGKPLAGEVRDAPSGNEQTESTQTEADWKQAVSQVARMAEARGSLPGHLKRIADIAKPKQDWRSILWRFAQAVSKDDYTWKYPNSRYISHDLYLPSLRSESMGEMIVFVDVSGSIDMQAFAEFTTELSGVHAALRPSRLIVIYGDTHVTRVDTFERDETPTFDDVHGGGGTDFRPLFAHVAAEGFEPVCAVFFTDMDGAFPAQAPDYPVLWANYGRERSTAPFGELINLE